MASAGKRPERHGRSDHAIGREIAFVAVFVALGLAPIPCIVIRIQEVEDPGPSAVIGSVVSLIDVGSVRRGTQLNGGQQAPAPLETLGEVVS